MLRRLSVIAERGPSLVKVAALGGALSWNLRIPEGLSCEKGVFKTHSHPIVDWHGPDGDGPLWHEWETNEEEFRIISSFERAELYEFVFAKGIRYRVRITPSERGLELLFTAENLTERTFHNVVVFPCLGYPSGELEDETLQRTFIITESGLTPLSRTDRGTGDPRRTHYRVAGRRAIKFVGEPFWGRSSETVALRGAILRTSRDGTLTVGFNWRQACEVFQNEDAHHCIHSCPTLGESRTARGRIILVRAHPQRPSTTSNSDEAVTVGLNYPQKIPTFLAQRAVSRYL